jgi:23S rRNA-/tRNA-specific pseudouridylate synthase
VVTEADPIPPLRLLFEEGGVVVVDKPAGLPSTGRDLQDPRSVEHRLAEQLGRRVWAVHQLDAGTSGVNVFVTRKSAVADWQARMKWPRAEKTYVAFVAASLSSRHLKLDGPLARDEGTGRMRVDASGKAALTLVEEVATSESGALVLARLRTGRTHQIRVHLAEAGAPLIGERVYVQPPCERHPRQALHAWRIGFRDKSHPPLESPLPADLVELAASMALKLPRSLQP